MDDVGSALKGGSLRPHSTPGRPLLADAPAPSSISAAAAPSDVKQKSLSGHQEYAMQVMTDYFSTRPLEQMRNAFRDADRDGSGELDVGEFCLAVRNMGSKLTDKDARSE